MSHKVTAKLRTATLFDFPCPKCKQDHACSMISRGKVIINAHEDEYDDYIIDESGPNVGGLWPWFVCHSSSCDFEGLVTVVNYKNL